MYSIFISTVPLLRAHGVDVHNSLIVDSRTEIDITWDPEDVLPADDDPSSYRIDVHAYTYDYGKSTWRRRYSHYNLPNDGHAKLKKINFGSKVEVVCFHVAVGASVSNSSSLSSATNSKNVASIIESLNSLSDKPFPSQAGIWSGLLFSISNSRSANESQARQLRSRRFDKECSKWHDKQSRILRNDNVFADLQACPPTQDRAELPNSGLHEARYDSVLYSTDYHTQWMQTFHPGATICFTQATVNRQVSMQTAVTSSLYKNIILQW